MWQVATPCLETAPGIRTFCFSSTPWWLKAWCLDQHPGPPPGSLSEPWATPKTQSENLYSSEVPPWSVRALKSEEHAVSHRFSNLAAYWSALESVKAARAWVLIPQILTTALRQGLDIWTFKSSPGTSDIHGLLVCPILHKALSLGLGTYHAVSKWQ